MTTQRTRYLPTERGQAPVSTPRSGAFRPASCSSSRRSSSRARSTSSTRTRSSSRSTPTPARSSGSSDIGVAQRLLAGLLADGPSSRSRSSPARRRRCAPATARCCGGVRSPGRSETSPVVVGKNVIVGSESGTVYALDRKDGELDWQVDTAGAVKGGLALDDGIALRRQLRRRGVRGARLATARVWQSSTQGLSFGRGGPVYSTPAVAFGRVYPRQHRQPRLQLRRRHGELAWSHSTGDWVYPGPAVADTEARRPDRLRRLQGPELLRARRRDRRRALAEGRRRRSSSAPPASSARSSTSADSGQHRHLRLRRRRPARGSSSHELGEYNPVISDGDRLYLTGDSRHPRLRAQGRRRSGRRRAEAERERREERARRARGRKRRRSGRRARSNAGSKGEAARAAGTAAAVAPMNVSESAIAGVRDVSGCVQEA